MDTRKGLRLGVPFVPKVRARRVFLAIALSLGLLLPLEASGQEAEGIPAEAELVDGVAAVVGRDVILVSEIEEQLLLFVAQLHPAARDTLNRDRLRQQILERLIDNHLLVAEATRAGIEVTTGEVTEAVERQMEIIRGNYPSEEAFQEELARAGLALTELRQSLRDEVQRQLLIQRVIESEVYSQVRITDEDVRSFYEEHRQEVPDRPETVVLDHILVVPRVSEASAEEVLRRLMRIRAEWERGGAFEDLARRYSEAPGAELGGLLGTFRRGDLDPAFAAAESAAFALAPGEVSQPVRTQLGLHLIRTEGREGDQVRAQHILLPLTPTAEDSAAARARIEEAWRQARAGEDFAELARRYSDDDVTGPEGGRLGAFEWEGLGDSYRRVLADREVGQVTEPFPTPQGLRIIRLVSHEESRQPTFEEIEHQLRELLAEERAGQKYQEWLAELREKIYIRVVRTGLDRG